MMQTLPRAATAPLLLRLADAPADPILLSNIAFSEDERQAKVNLGIGMYYDEDGRVPLMRAVRAAAERLMQAGRPWVYGSMEGHERLRALAPKLLFDADAAAACAAIQTIGGTGALALGGEVLHAVLDAPVVAISTPSWPNHVPIFRRLGYKIRSYRYFDAKTHGLDFDGLIDDLSRLPRRSVVVLHGCCHNPTGVDLDVAQWEALAAVLVRRDLLPFLDMAYLGFGEDLVTDAQPARLLASHGLTIMIALSFSKSFSLYGERVGALVVHAPEPDGARLAFGHARLLARASYSMPPTHGAMLTATILDDAALAADWRAELAGMRQRIRTMRQRLVDQLHRNDPTRSFEFMRRQRGLFSYSGLGGPEIERMRREDAVYAVPDGRLCIAGLNGTNIDRVAASISGSIRAEAASSRAV